MNPKEQTNGIDKLLTGVPGFDEITNGGIPKGRTTLIQGEAGSGKTVFALQTLVNGARMLGEAGIFVAFEENSRQITENAATFGWDLPALEKEKLFFLDARMSPDMVMSGGFDLNGMLASIVSKAEEIGATRVVFDSIDVLLTLLDDPVAKRRELYRIRDWLSETGLTGIMTLRASNDTKYIEDYGFMQFMADCVIVLNHSLVDHVSLRGARIAKYRGSQFSENEFPMIIGPRGIEIAKMDLSEPDYEVFTERVSTGVERLDAMLNGGYLRGSSILITGAPGTAKSSLAGTFIEAACKRAEKALYVSFDESANEIIRNMTSINIHLLPYVRSGILRMYSARTESRSAEEHLINIRKVIEEQQPGCMVVDPLSAMVKAGGHITALGVAQRLIHLAKSKGMTLLCTSLLEFRGEPFSEATEIRISTVADTWINLSYIAKGGERNRALSIVKSRGTRHSNQVREMILSDEGITLADVYTAGGEVLMGTLRWEREKAERRAEEQRQMDAERKRIELELADSEINARIQSLKRELEANRTELKRLSVDEAAYERDETQRLADLQGLRRAD
ncbi:MAG: circadian clock protein KaiC [Methanotrichaceae archaeon]|nr:circadian clock protein KaiC [Methanotrichaceae archaeon]